MVNKLGNGLSSNPELQMQLMLFAMENASIEIYWLGSDAHIYYANSYACKTMGYSKDEFRQLSLSDLDPNYPMELWPEHWQNLKHDKTQSFETLHKRKNGEIFPVSVVANYVSFNGHEYNVGFAKDETERKRVEEKLQEKEEFFRLISENVEDYIAVLDLEGRRLYNNPSYANLIGGIRNLIGTDSFAEIHPDDRDRIKELFKETIQTGIGHRSEYRFMLPDNSIRHMESRGGLVKDTHGEPLRVIVVSHDITDRKKAEEEIFALAFHDPLTRLANRRLFIDRLEQTIALSKRSGVNSALLFLDLDNFKPLNDKHGHAAGDMLLIEVARRINSCVREVDTVARFGGDEFMVMLSELDKDNSISAKQAAVIAEKIRVTLAEPYLIKVQHYGKAEIAIEHRCTSSIGVTLFSNQGGNAEDIIHLADKAMYHAKEAGRDQVQFDDFQI